MTELGQTNDPEELVPGNVAAVENTAVVFSTYGDNLHDAGAGLARIDTTEGWSGDAAEKFRGVFHGQPGK